MGEGAVVMVVDYPVDYRHEDLVDNVDVGRSVGLAGVDFDDAGVNHHGTAMASIIAARDNDVGMRGVAPRAQITSHPITGWEMNWYWKTPDAGGAAQFVPPDRSAAVMDAAVINHSYSRTNSSRPWKVGSVGGGSRFDAYDALAERGFGGLGAVNVVSGGKRLFWPSIGWSTLAEERSHPAVVVACAVQSDGVRASWGNTSFRGPNLWVCAPSAGFSAQHNNRYEIGGGAHSSPATAMVSGVAALVRAANPKLSWRDVKLILAETAQRNDAGSDGWQAAGSKYSRAGERYGYHHAYGFGVVDASAAVQLALDWGGLPEYRSELHKVSMDPVEVPEGAAGVSSTVAVASDIDFVEYVEARLDLAAPWFRDLRVELVSPSGAVSVLSRPFAAVPARPLGGGNVAPGTANYPDMNCDRPAAGVCGISGWFRFGSSAHLGEAASGTWRLRLVDEKANTRVNTLKSWSLKLYGHKRQSGVPTQPVPVVSVWAGGDATEGGDASFTVIATPAPAKPLGVKVKVAAQGDYGVSAGTHTVTIPVSGSATLTLPTVDDGAVEADGSVTVTVAIGAGYRLGSPSSASIAISDDDDPLSGAAVEVPAGWSLAPPGAVAGDRFRLLLRTSTRRDATSSDIADYDAHVRAAVAAGHADVRAYSDEFLAVGSTATVDARDHLGFRAGGGWVAGVPIWWLDAGGNGKLVADGYHDFCDQEGTGVNPAIWWKADVLADMRDESGRPASGDRPWTGSTNYCVSTHRGNDALVGLGSSRVSFGAHREGRYYGPLSDGEAAPSQQRPLYALSPVFEIAASGKQQEQAPPPTPVVSISGGSGVTEGANAPFTVTAVPKPAAPLAVKVVVTASGGFGVAEGKRTVMVPVSGSVSFTVATADDGVDEPDGWVMATVVAGSGYAVSSSQASAAVAVADDETVVSISGGSGVTEGGDAVFTVTAVPKPAAPLAVKVVVASEGDWGVAAGTRSVMVPVSGSVSFTVATADDGVDEPDGWVMATVVAGSGYAVSSSQASAAVAVADDETVVSISGGSGVTEGGDAVFTVTAVPKPAA
ncbi:MAG: S8 family serine peptidase, partial [bacterium]|nr:S8 family serine peptidase [bacterium]